MINTLRNLFAKRAGKTAFDEAAAYHLSGQAVIAYYHGYECRSMYLGKDASHPSALSIDFKKDEPLVNSLLQYRDNPVLYAVCTGEQKLACLDVAPRLLLVLQAGPVAREIKLSGKRSIATSTQPDTGQTEQQPLQNVSAFLTKFKPHSASDPLQDALGDLVLMFKISQIWQAVEALASACLKNKSRGLDKASIEKVLVDTGYMRFIGGL
ncbi:MAG: hypothetical protein Q8932_05390 [Bacteroidota bacterium]|nr:hypothetical protein [Bacteroidota bacterium]MDP4253936.1 hypothetical protein [Bacteroidota bacterium]MDP4259424.1 hypothetical protein [Bacteroidota bacterium]